MPKADKMTPVSHNQKLERNQNEQTMAISNKYPNTMFHKSGPNECDSTSILLKHYVKYNVYGYVLTMVKMENKGADL